jgi:hypothetical protein
MGWSFFALLLVACSGLSCSGKDARQPGTVVGTFHVEGAKQMATCGDAASAPDPWVFDVRFSRSGSTLYWVQNRAPISGHISADRTAKLETSQTLTVRQGDRFGTGECIVTRADTLEATLGPDEPLGDAGTGGFSSITGTLTYTFASDPTSDCSKNDDPAVSVLPCSTVYAVHASKVGP